MTLLEDLIAWWKKHQAELRRQIEMMESGALRSGEKRPGEGWVDTTEESLARARHQLAEIDAALARYPEDS